MLTARDNVNSARGRLPLTLACLWCICTLVCSASPPNASAQGSVRAWGMAGAHTSCGRGLEAVSCNPANLALGDQGMSIGIASAAIDLHNNSFSLSRYNEISGGTLDQADKQQILADIPPEGLQLQADVQASALGLRSGPWAISFQLLGGASGNLDAAFVDLVLMGNELDRQISFDQTHGELYAVGAITFSTARPILERPFGRLCLGVNLRYLRGLYEAHVERAEGSLSTGMTGLTGSASAAMLSASGGRGYGIDLGLALQTPGGWVLGLAADNLMSGMSWTGDPERHLWQVTADNVTVLQDNLDEAIADTDTTYGIDPYSGALPRRIRVGASRNFASWLLACDLNQGLENRAGVTTQTSLNVGAEWHALPWLLPRGGISLGGSSRAGAAAGLGLRIGPWRLDLAAVSRGSFWPRDSRGLALAAGTSCQF